MSLSERQQEFMHCVALLILHAEQLGYRVTGGDLYRDPRLHGTLGEKKGYGSKNSNHKQRLAIDLNLFKDGIYLSSSKDHLPLAEYWESLHPCNRSGIRFNDGNHYERLSTPLTDQTPLDTYVS